jgi:hypothetical protein
MKPEAHSSTNTAGAANTAASANVHEVRIITKACVAEFVPAVRFQPLEDDV